MTASRRTDLDEAYRSYAGDYARRWDGANPGNRALLEERQLLAEELLSGRPAAARVLDIGAGVAGSFPGLVPDAFDVELELLYWRLADGREPRAAVAPVCGDGCALPFPDRTFDLVLLSTVLSSVAPPTAEAMVAEIRRVLRPGGALLLYDFRVRNPGNRNTRPVTARQLRRLLVGWDLRIRSLTVLPPLARRLGRRAGTLYPVLARVPLLRSHLLVLAVPPGS